jgi:hypothetical protein
VSGCCDLTIRAFQFPTTALAMIGQLLSTRCNVLTLSLPRNLRPDRACSFVRVYVRGVFTRSSPILVRLSIRRGTRVTWFASAVIVSAVGWGVLHQNAEPILPPICYSPSVRLIAATPRVKIGERPEFSVVVSNNDDRPIRILDLRNGRRPDLHNTYLELLVLESGHRVETMVYFSDPGPTSSRDFLQLAPHARVEFRQIRYTAFLEKLPAGAYEALVLFWQDPAESHTKRCRSTSAHFNVYR